MEVNQTVTEKVVKDNQEFLRVNMSGKDYYLPFKVLSGKKVAFFATSGGSDVTKVAGKLGPMMKGEIIGSQLFQPDASVQSLKKWVESL